jgi:hypothetical protein
MADVVLDTLVAHPDEMWVGLHNPANPGDSGLPATVTKETFGTWLVGPEAKPWLAKRHAQSRDAMRNNVQLTGS